MSTTQDKFISKMLRVSHVYDDDLETLINECQKFGLKNTAIEDDYVYLDDLDHAIKIV